MTVSLCGLIHGRPREEVLDPDWEPMRLAREIAPFHPEIAEVAEGSFKRQSPPEIVGSGYVVKSLEAALWAVHDAEDFREAVLRAVNLGDDADTTGAICGQFAGAMWGEPNRSRYAPPYRRSTSATVGMAYCINRPIASIACCWPWEVRCR